jgi:ribosome-associated protein
MTKKLQAIIEDALDDLKAKDITVMDVKGISDVMDTMVIATGTSSRHVKSLASNVILDGKKTGHSAIGVEGMDEGEWVLVDYGDTVVHVMQAVTRDFYELEKLWSTRAESHPEAEPRPAAEPGSQ